jgi:hypothetical protein
VLCVFNVTFLRKVVMNQIGFGDQIALRAQGIGWKRIAAELGVGVGTAIRNGE